jgi:DNA-binding MarR family transcriptional regulator
MMIIVITDKEVELQDFENAMRSFFQTLKSPLYWNKVVGQSQIPIDRPSATIIQALAFGELKNSRVLDLAHLLKIEAPSVTRKSQELEKAGLLIRSHDQNDRRITNLLLTALGLEKAKILRNTQRSIIASALDDWSFEDKNILIFLFEKFSKDFAQTLASPNL